MVAADNECAPIANNEVFHISLYNSVIRDKRVNASVNVRETHMTTQEAEHGLEGIVRGHHV